MASNYIDQSEYRFALYNQPSWEPDGWQEDAGSGLTGDEVFSAIEGSVFRRRRRDFELFFNIVA